MSPQPRMMTDASLFYYLNGENQPVGPMSLDGIRRMVEVGVVGPEVLVCPVGQQEWEPLARYGRRACQAGSTAPPRVPPMRPPASASPRAAATGSASRHREWFLLASVAAGMISVIMIFFLPAAAFLLAVPALAGGIFGYRSPYPDERPLSIVGLAVASPALVVSLGILLFNAGNPKARYVGSWRNDLSVQIMLVQTTHSIIVTFHEDGRFTDLSGVLVSGANYDTGDALRMTGGGKTTGYWEWDRRRKALVTRHDGRNPTLYFDGASNDGRGLRFGPFDDVPSTRQAQEEFWVFRPDPDDSRVLIGEHPTMYHNRTMRFHRVD